MAAEALLVTAGVGLVQSGLLAGIFLRLGETATTLDHHETRISSNEEEIEENREELREVRA